MATPKPTLLERVRDVKDWLPYLISAGALLLAVINTLYSRRRDAQGDWKARFKELTEKLETMVNRLTILETKAEIYFRGMSVFAAQDLHSPHTPELDRLLEKFQRDEIQNEKELYELKRLLRDIADHDPDLERRKLADKTLLLIHVRFEIGGDLITALRKQDQSVDRSIAEFSARTKP